MRGAQTRRRDDEAMTEAAEQALDAPPRTPAQELLAMQQTAGNQAVARMIASGRVARDGTRAPAKGKPAPKKGKEKPQPAASGIQVKIDGIVGEGPGGAIEAFSYSWGRTGASPGGAGAPKEEVDLHLTAKLGIHSPKLNAAAAQGRTLKSVEIRMVAEGKPYMTIRMKSVAVTSYQVGGGDVPTESFALLASEVETEYDLADDNDGG